jgi:hypothetical protein
VKVIFLDIDGVLNSYWFFRFAAESKLDIAPPHNAIDRKAVRWLNALVEETGAKVVISSTWRLLWPLDEVVDALLDKGFGGQVIDKTPDLQRRAQRNGATTDMPQRGDEIRAWLDEHPEVTAFVVFDDSDDMDAVRDNFVWVNGMKGLKPKHVAQAASILGGA